MPRHTPRRPLAAVPIGLVLALAGCSAATPDLSSDSAKVPTASASPAGASAPAPTAATADSMPTLTADRLATALPSLPAGATPWPANLGPAGPLTATQYATAMFGAADASADLQIEKQRGLDFGAIRRWNQTDGVMVSVFLGHYSLPLGAQSAFLAQSTSEEHKDAADQHFTVPGVPESYGVALSTLDSYGDAQTNLHLVAGDVLIRIAVGSPAQPDPTVAAAVAKTVYANVCGITDCASSAG